MVNASQNNAALFDQMDSSGLVENIKHSIQPEVVAQKIGVDKNLLIDVGMYGVIGLIIGFLLKKYSEYFIAFILFFIGIIILQQFDYLALSWNAAKIHEALGLQGMPMTSDSYGTLLLEWARSHVISASSLLVGFLIGLKVG